MSRESTWVFLAQRDEEAKALARVLRIPEPLAAILRCRGIRTADEARAFLEPATSGMHPPALMLGMGAAVDRLRHALLAREPILIYGDYDVDGTVATVLLKTALERAAASLSIDADVRYHIPHRLREGYGMQASRMEMAKAEGVRLIVSVDTGIRAFAAAEEAKRLGLDLIVTDHHLPDGVDGIPEALAVLNPNQPGDMYPYKDLCGAAVSFKLAQAVLESLAKDEKEQIRLTEKVLPSFLKLLAIATIADAVPLTGENRVIASLGLRELRRPSQSGLRALMELSKIDTNRPLSASDVGFRLAPRINAGGRMDIASDVVEMFLSKDAALAKRLAEKLHRLNDDRRTTEADALREIETRLEKIASVEAGMGQILVLDDAGLSTPWHRGILGILASRVVDRTGLPTLVVTHEDGAAHGSGRSVAGFHLLDALAAVHAEETLFTRFGGHAHAVGFTLPSEHVATLRERLEAYTAANPTKRSVIDDVECDVELGLGEITADFLAALEKLGPFGNGNREPIFFTRGARLTAAVKVVKEQHLRVSVEDPADGARMGGMAWARHRVNFPELASRCGWNAGVLLDLAYRLRKNWHPDFGGWEMEIVALRTHINIAA